MFLLQRLLVLLIKLVTTLIVSSVMDENTGITEATVAMLVVVFAAFRVVIDSSCAPNERWSFHWSFQCPRKCFLPQLILSQRVIVCIAIFASVYIWVDFTFLDRLRDLHVLLSVEEPVLLRVDLQVLIAQHFSLLLELLGHS